MPPRTEARAAFEERVRIALLETDMDEVDESVFAVKGRIDKLTWTIGGAAITLATSSVLLAINLILHSGG